MIRCVDRIWKYTTQILFRRSKNVQNVLLFMPQQRESLWSIFLKPLPKEIKKLRTCNGLIMFNLFRIQKYLYSLARRWFSISNSQSTGCNCRADTLQLLHPLLKRKETVMFSWRLPRCQAHKPIATPDHLVRLDSGLAVKETNTIPINASHVTGLFL